MDWNPVGRKHLRRSRIILSGRGLGEGSAQPTPTTNLSAPREPSPPPSPGVPGEGGRLSPATSSAKRLEPGKWHTLDLAWKVEHTPPRGAWPGECVVSIDEVPVTTLPQSQRAIFGLSYLRLHSTAPGVDPAGFLVEKVSAKVEPLKKP